MTPTDKSLAIFYHIGNSDPQFWDYFAPYIQRVIDSTTIPVDLYITYQKQAPILDVIKQQYPNVVMIESLLGCDCGGQLLMMHTAMNSGKHYDYTLKIHSKTRLDWRNDMMEPICGSPTDLQRVYEIFERDPTVGMIGAQKWKMRMDNLNVALIDGICKRLDMKYDRASQYFLGGTIFWMRWKTMVDIITAKKIDLIHEYTMMEPGYTPNNRPTVTHSWERLFGILVYNAGQVLHGISNDPREREQREKQAQVEKERERIKRELDLAEKIRKDNANRNQLTFLEAEQKRMEYQELEQIKRHEDALKKLEEFHRQADQNEETLQRIKQLEAFHQRRLEELLRRKSA